MRTLLRLSVSLLVLLLFAASVRAQSRGSISGTVVDPLNGRVSGAALKLLRDGKAVTDTVSNATGEFTFDALTEGRYQIEASAPGFQRRTTDPLFVGSNRVSVDVALPVGPLEQSVSVTAAATDVLPAPIGAPVAVLQSATIDAISQAAET